MTHLIDSLETQTNWGKFFTIADSLYHDQGFTSAGDNFLRNTVLEKALDLCSELTRVDKKGHDFLYKDGTKVELKVSRTLFYKKNPHKSKTFKVKSFLSETRTVEDFRKEQTFDYLMLVSLEERRVVLVEDERARELYQTGSDGAVMSVDKGDYYQLDFSEVNTPPTNKKVSDYLSNAIDTFLSEF